MLFEKPAERKYLIGFDLRDDFCQISYMDRTIAGKEPVTFSLSASEEKFDIPTALYKAADTNQWAAGQSAANMSSDSSGTYLPGLLSLAMEGKPVVIEKNEYDPAALLALFIRRCLALVEKKIPEPETRAVMFTARNMDRKMIRILESVRNRLDLKYSVYYEGYANSAYHYMMMQPKDIREPGSFFCEYEKDGELRISKLRFNRKTTPIVAYREESVYPGFVSDSEEGRDEEFLGFLQDTLKENGYASAYLIGSGFRGLSMKKSVAFICKGRRAFMGNNLYSRGAAYGALFKTDPPVQSKGYFFLDDKKLRTNIGIRAVQKGETGTMSLLEAGGNWYETDKTVDLVLEDGNELNLLMKPLTGKEATSFLIRLDGLPAREGRTTRIRLHFTMTAPDKLLVQIEDLGFGEIFPSGGLKWEQEITV